MKPLLAILTLAILPSCSNLNSLIFHPLKKAYEIRKEESRRENAKPEPEAQ